MKCETQGCKSKGAAKEAVGRFQVYDTDYGTPTMSRPAYLCQGCVDVARECGMEPHKE